MQQSLFFDVPESERPQFLRDNCEKLEPITYMKPFGSNELEVFKDQLSEIDIEIDRLSTAKKESSDSFNNQLKPLKTEHKRLLTDIRLKSTEVKEDCFVFIDTNSKMVGHYNAKGLLVQSRPARPQELQASIFSVTRTGTDGY